MGQLAEGSLLDIYFIIRDTPAWLSWCKEAGYSQEELDYLERLDDDLMHYRPKQQADKEVMRPYIEMLKTVRKLGDKKKHFTQSEIETARAYPLENLVGEELVKGRMPCPFHGGKDRNFLVKNGFGYCFVCGIRIGVCCKKVHAS